MSGIPAAIRRSAIIAIWGAQGGSFYYTDVPIQCKAGHEGHVADVLGVTVFLSNNITMARFSFHYAFHGRECGLISLSYLLIVITSVFIIGLLEEPGIVLPHPGLLVLDLFR